MNPVSVLVAIVNYRTPRLAIEAAAAIQAEAIARDARVAIVDNGSADGSAEVIAAEIERRGFSGWCSLIAESRNGGFAAGNNAAMRWHRRETGTLPPYVWLLNPDTIAEPGAMGALIDFLDRIPSAGIAGSRCLEQSGAVWASAFRFMSPMSELASAFRFGPVTRLLGNPVVAPPQPSQPARTEWVSGTSMMIRRAVIEQVGLMDEDYFLYFEETEYCARAAAAGFEIWTVPDSRVVHIGGQSTGVTGEARSVRRRPRYWFASRARFFVQRYGVGRAHLANLLWLAGYPIGRLIALLRGRPNDDPPHFWRDFLAAYYGPGGIMYRPGTRARRMGTSHG